MAKIIETNLSIENDVIVDHQSRVIDFVSWEKYVEAIHNGESLYAKSKTMPGNILLSNATTNNIVYDNFHLRCEVNSSNWKSIKLAYLIRYEDLSNAMKV